MCLVQDHKSMAAQGTRAAQRNMICVYKLLILLCLVQDHNIMAARKSWYAAIDDYSWVPHPMMKILLQLLTWHHRCSSFFDMTLQVFQFLRHDTCVPVPATWHHMCSSFFDMTPHVFQFLLHDTTCVPVSLTWHHMCSSFFDMTPQVFQFLWHDTTGVPVFLTWHHRCSVCLTWHYRCSSFFDMTPHVFQFLWRDTTCVPVALTWHHRCSNFCDITPQVDTTGVPISFSCVCWSSSKLNPKKNGTAATPMF